MPVRPAVADEGDVLVQQVRQRGRDARQDSRQDYGVQAGYHVRGYGGREVPDTDAMEAIVDVAETYAHPSNNGRWHQNIALFVQHSVRYFRKRCASRRHVDSAPVSDELKRTFARCMMRLIDPGMYSKNGKFRVVASSCAGQLAYLCPAAVLPKVMTRRFQEAIEHSDCDAPARRGALRDDLVPATHDPRAPRRSPAARCHSPRTTSRRCWTRRSRAWTQTTPHKTLAR